MKKSIYLFYSCCLLWFSCREATETIEVKDERGKVVERFEILKKSKLRHGLYERFYSTDTLAEVQHYDHEQPIGEHILYYENGKMQQLTTLNPKGEFEGICKSFFETGTLQSEGKYSHNAMNGEWKFYFPSGELKEVVNFVDNTENGAFTEYFQNGKIAAKGTYKNEKEEGSLELFNEDGSLKRRMNCESGICKTVFTDTTTVSYPKGQGY